MKFTTLIVVKTARSCQQRKHENRHERISKKLQSSELLVSVLMIFVTKKSCACIATQTTQHMKNSCTFHVKNHVQHSEKQKHSLTNKMQIKRSGPTPLLSVPKHDVEFVTFGTTSHKIRFRGMKRDTGHGFVVAFKSHSACWRSALGGQQPHLGGAIKTASDKERC